MSEFGQQRPDKNATAVTQRFCPKCGIPRNNDDSFCSCCGFNFETQAGGEFHSRQETEQTDESGPFTSDKKSIVFASVVVCIVAVIVVVSMIISNSGIGEESKEKHDKKILCEKWVSEDDLYDLSKSSRYFEYLEFFSDGTAVDDDDTGVEWDIVDGKLKLSDGLGTTKVYDYEIEDYHDRKEGVADNDARLVLTDQDGKQYQLIRESSHAYNSILQGRDSAYDDYSYDGDSYDDEDE